MPISVNRVTNANLYVDGTSFLGKIKEMTLPNVNAKMVEHVAIGLQGPVDLPAGFEKMEAKVVWNSFYKDALVKLGNIYKSVNLMARFSVETYSGGNRVAQVPGVVFLTVTPKNLPTGDFKQSENAELETTLNVLAFKMEIDGDPVTEIDPVNNVYMVNGVDLLAEYRANIGQ